MKFFARLFRKARPIQINDNVLTLDRYFRAKYFSRVRRAIDAQGLRGKYKASAINHMNEVWQKHLDRVPDYATVQEAIRQAIKFVDERTEDQRNARRTLRDWPWSPRVA